MPPSSLHYVSVALKIPDNEAYTALTALQRLGVPVARLERSRVYRVDGSERVDALAAIERDEAIFNPNKHVAALLDSDAPRRGETWIEELGGDGGSCTAWRLFDAHGDPVDDAVVRSAADALLCNPAVERAR